MTTDTDSHDEPPATTRRRVLRTTAAAAITTGGIGTASASHDQGFFAGMSGVSGDWSSGALVDGLTDGIIQRIRANHSGAETNALETKGEFNDHSGDWVTYANDRNLGGLGHQVLEATFVQDGERYTVYLVSDYDDGAEKYTSAEIVDSTTRTVDHEVRLESIAAENADEELQTLHDEYIGPGETIDAEHVQYLTGRYYVGPDKHITSTLLGEELTSTLLG
jgi:hypothetical protein